MENKITLEHIHTFSIPLSEHPGKWKFISEKEQLSNEYKDQIVALNPKASSFLREFKNSQKYLSSTINIAKYFNEVTYFSKTNTTNQNVKKWLYEKGIPFNQRVFCFIENNWGFLLTWKMLIKFSDSLFGGSEVYSWDKTSNWCLIYDHEDVFCFGKNLNYNSEKHSQELKKIEEMINKTSTS
jgi:hypothetical protein